MGLAHCINLLYVLLLLVTGSNGEQNEVDIEVDNLIRKVGEMDKYFSTDLHRLYNPGKRGLKWTYPNMTFGDWTLEVDTFLGPGYRGPVVTDERAKLYGIMQSLNVSGISANAHDKHGRICKVKIEGPQLARNYIRYYRRLKEKMSSDTGIMGLGFEYSGANVTLGLMQDIHVNEEGMIKYLPYRVQDLKEVYGFTIPGDDVPSLFTKYEISVSGDCLPDYEFLNGSEELYYHQCHPMLFLVNSQETCFDFVKDLEEDVDQFFMVAIALQTMFFHMHSSPEGYSLTHRVCTVRSIEGISFEVDKRQFAINKCCTMMKSHLLPYEYEKGWWFCYNPYSLSNTLVTMSKLLSLVLLVISPLTIQWLPEIHAKVKQRVKADRTSFIPGTSLQLSDDVKQEAPSTTSRVELDETELWLKTDINKDINTEWMFLDDDSGYHFSIKVILWHLLLFGLVNRGIIILRRFLFLYMILLMTYLAALQIHLQYPDLYQNTWQFYFTTFAYQIYRIQPEYSDFTKYKFDMMMTLSLFVIPFAMAVTQFLLLSPILFRKDSIAQTLYWNEKDTAIGKYVGLKVQNIHQDVCHQPHEIKLFLNISARVSYIACFKFWRYIFTQSIFDNDNNNDSNTTCSMIIKTFIRVLLLPMMVPVYTFPIFSVFWGIFCGDRGFSYICKTHFKVFLACLVLGLGVVYFASVLFACITMYVYMAMFILIDVIRTLTNTFTHVIFFISAIVNIKQMFSSVEDRYREMKLMVFKILEDMNNSPEEKEQMVSRNMLKRFDKSTVAIPRSLFVQVCEEHMTYSRLVTTALLVLLFKLALLCLLYMIIVDYQVFAQLSATGEGFITIIFVSLPSLLSREKSGAQKELEEQRMSLKVKCTIIEVSQAAETFPADSTKSESKV